MGIPMVIRVFYVLFLLMFFCYYPVIGLGQNSFSLEDGLLPSILLERDTGRTFSLKKRIADYHVQGLNFVIFKNGRIVRNEVFGWSRTEMEEKVSFDTKFQAASISKPLTAFGVLLLADAYGLDLDVDVNRYLKTWKIPESSLTAKSKVTLRRLLNHTSGINYEGFAGYRPNEKMPSLLEVLNGANGKDRIEVVSTPGERFSYSGGAYVVLAKLIEDVSGMSFETYFETTVFRKLKMRNSSFRQQPKGKFSFGYDQDGIVTENGYRKMPEMAPNGLWTTAQDLALFCLTLQDIYEGKKQDILPKRWLDQMILPSSFMEYGLGLGLKLDSTHQYFFHMGQNPGGFTGAIISDLRKRQGIVVLVNSEDPHLVREIVNGYAKANQLGYARGLSGPQEIVKTISVSERELALYKGRYRSNEQQEEEVEIRLTNDSGLSMRYLTNGYTALLCPIKPDIFFEVFTGLEVIFFRDPHSHTIEKVMRRGKIFFRK